jgi:hypothetical protein
MKTKLKICPFCGSVPDLYESTALGKPKRYRIECSSNCGVQPKTAPQTTKELAMCVWNERHDLESFYPYKTRR